MDRISKTPRPTAFKPPEEGKRTRKLEKVPGPVDEFDPTQRKLNKFKPIASAEGPARAMDPAVDAGFVSNNVSVQTLKRARSESPPGHDFATKGSVDTSFFPIADNPQFVLSVDRDRHAGLNSYKMFKISKKLDKTSYYGTVNLEVINGKSLMIVRGRDGLSIKDVKKGEAYGVDANGKWYKITDHEKKGKILEPMDKAPWEQ